MGSNPVVYWMDVIDTSYYISNEKKKKKVAKWGTPKKYFEKTFLLKICLHSFHHTQEGCLRSRDFRKILPKSLESLECSGKSTRDFEDRSLRCASSVSNSYLFQGRQEFSSRLIKRSWKCNLWNFYSFEKDCFVICMVKGLNKSFHSC